MRANVLVPLVFVFLWSTAYIGFELCAAYAEPATFVLLRVFTTAVLVRFIICFRNVSWPERFIDIAHSAVVGILIHGIYAGSVFAALYHGLDAGLCALILGMQPLITTAISIAWLNESITGLKMVGILFGFTGVVMLITLGEGGVLEVVLNSDKDLGENSSTGGMLLCFIALMAISIGMLYQKRYCKGTELLPGSCIQFTAAAVFMLPFALTMESMKIHWNWSFVLGFSWLIFVVSIGAMSLLMVLIRHGEAGSVSNLFFLVPPLVAIQAWLFFDEQLNLVSMAAMLVCIVGVMLVGYASRVHTALQHNQFIFSRTFLATSIVDTNIK